MPDGGGFLRIALRRRSRKSSHARALPVVCPWFYSDPWKRLDRASTDGPHLSGAQ
jgi:hypothetical protein